MDETVTFRVTVTGTYSIPASNMQEFYGTADTQEAAQLDLATFDDDLFSAVSIIEEGLQVSVKVVEDSE